MISLRPMTECVWPEVKRIYEEGIATGEATFETQVPDWTKWNASHIETCRIVAVNPEEILGWAALSRVSTRHVYRGVAEVSVYVSESARGKGIGRLLMNGLVSASEDEGIWTLQASVFPENSPSVKLHESCGFRIVGRRERIAWLNGKWRDTCLLERRSSRIGAPD